MFSTETNTGSEAILSQATGQTFSTGHGRFLEQRVDLMFRTARSASALAAFAVIVCFCVFAYMGTTPALWFWLCAVLVTNAGRFLLFNAYQHHKHRKPLKFWLRTHMLTGVLTGLAWGLLPLHSVEGQPLAFQTLVLIIPTFIATGAINAYGIILPQYRAFLLSIFFSLIASHAWHSGMEALLTDVIFVFVVGGLLRMARHFQSGLMDALDAQVRLQATNEELASTNEALARQQAQAEQEQALATHVYRQLVSGSDRKASCVRTWTQPVSNFSGDLALVTRGPSGHIYFMLGDFTGHGLPAALGAVPTAGIFLAMAHKGMSVDFIAQELHKRLSTLLPVGYFCCASIGEFNPETGRLNVWNGGLPPMLIRRHATGHVEEYPSDHLPLAVGGDELPFSKTLTHTSLAPRDALYVFSDGLIEASDERGDAWGMNRLKAALAEDNIDATRIDHLQATLDTYIGTSPPSDDISLIELHPVGADEAADGANRPEDIATQ